MGVGVTIEQDKEIVENLRGTFKSGITRTPKYRKTQLENLIKLYEEGEDEVETLFNEDLQFAEYAEGVEKYASELSQSEDLPFYDRKGPKVSKLKEKVMAAPARERSKRAAAQVASEKWVEDDLNVPLAKVTPQPTRSSRRREALQEFNE